MLTSLTCLRACKRTKLRSSTEMRVEELFHVGTQSEDWVRGPFAVFIKSGRQRRLRRPVVSQALCREDLALITRGE